MRVKKDEYQENLERIEQELRSNEAYRSFFEQYQEKSVDSFIFSYAQNKALLITYGSTVQNSRESAMREWQQGAWKALKEIQHKKLFDLSCKWQMGEIKNLPQIETTMDFKQVGKQILDYEGIPDVTSEEIEMYSRFLNSGIVLEYYSLDYDYQDYEEIHEAYNADLKTNIPYYDFHNELTNNKSLRYYGGIRKEKEEAYIRAAVSHRQSKPTKKPKIASETKPYLRSSDEEMIKFAREHNDLKLAAYLQEMHTYWREEHDERIEWASRYLKDAYPEKIPISASDDWAEGLLNAALAHKQKKIDELLPSIYDEYRFKKSTGIKLHPQKEKEGGKGFHVWYRDMILEGRELQGEPKNFDF